MNSCLSINLIAIGLLLKRYKLTTTGKHVNIKAAHKKYSTCFGLRRISKKNCV